jgi:nucleotidyltransferase/DNA polymerase involved in DNA repair
MSPQPHVLYVQLVTPHRRVPPAPGDFERVLDLAIGLTPVVEQLPPDAFLLDIAGALRYFGRSPVELAGRLRVRALALSDLDLTVGVASNPLLARMAAHQGKPGAVRVLHDDEVQRFLAPLPVIALPGVGPATATTLSGYGIELIGQLATTPVGTLQRILGAAAGRRLHERAQGLDPAKVTITSVLRALTADQELGRDELDPVRHRRALLALAQDLGLQLRTQQQATTALTLTIRYADRTTTVRTRKLTEATAHTTALVDAAYRLYGALGLQRARVRAFTLKADGIRPAEAVTQQLTFDPTDERLRRIEAVADRARKRFGADSIGPASLYGAA